MFTRTIFIHSYDLHSKACAKLFVEKKHMAQTKALKDSTRKRQKKGGFSKLCVKIKKDAIPTYSIFQHVSII
jgi:hypothetical protein